MCFMVKMNSSHNYKNIYFVRYQNYFEKTIIFQKNKTIKKWRFVVPKITILTATGLYPPLPLKCRPLSAGVIFEFATTP